MSPMMVGILIAALLFGSLFLYNLAVNRKHKQSLRSVLEELSFTVVGEIDETRRSLAGGITPSASVGSIPLFAERLLDDHSEFVYSFEAPQHQQNDELFTNTVGTVFCSTGPETLPQLRIANKGSAARRVLPGGMPKVATGDPEFDRDYLVHAESDEIARRWLNPEVRSWLMRLPDWCTWHVEPGLVAVQPLSMPTGPDNQRRVVGLPHEFIRRVVSVT